MTTQLSIPKIILDTDPGGDDIFAFLWLLSLVKKQYAELIAVTSADGNVAAKRTFSSASQLLNLVGFPDIEVGRGIPVKREALEDASHIHGSDGMGNLSHTLPPATHNFEKARCSDEIIIDKLNTHPGEITIVAIGPLTNLAAAEEKSPGILKKAKEIVIMGGAFFISGNVTPHAEFNIWFNPEAAQTVFDSRNDIVVLPLDVTQHLIFTRDMAQVVSQTNPKSKLSQFLIPLVEFMIGTALEYRETARIPGLLVHDAATLGYLFYPETLFLRRAKVRIETKGEWTKGQTLIDSRPAPKTEANAWVALQVDESKFFTSLVEDLNRLFKSAII
ncbi:nucleoside hydrolase [Nodularia sp. NIES-3585]|uniref:nucleoside hydrolase n=1 Tax=Nodularia sp. NIES-3585 TaxID=1973477 RepID=UPI000B5CD2CC|nr:nucleoside hydrolase [Nodularia sp. NIES-3585]GAX38217.1 inosine-uridine preferring nucleoside hydrolase superfamily protein [Nodularia sp. NIES-3585]